VIDWRARAWARAVCRCAAVASGLLSCPWAGAEPQRTLPLAVVADVALPGDTSRFDYASFDAAKHRLFLAHLGANEILVVDTLARAVVGRIKDVSRVHGVLAVAQLDRVYASATGTNEVVAIDAVTLRIVARIPGGRYPDGMAYAPQARKLYVSDQTGATETVIDAGSNHRVATIELGGEAGNSQYDPVTRHVFVNVQSRHELIEIDPATDAIVARDNLPGADGNHGLLIYPQRRLALIACEGNDRLLVFDLVTRAVTQTFPLGAGPDVLAADEQAGIAYVASESGVIDVFKVDSAIRHLAQAQLAPDAHVVAVDPATQLVYFPIRELSGHPVLRIARYTGH